MAGLVLDTHAWLWLLASPERLSKPARRAIERAGEVGVAVVSAFELAENVERGRLRLARPLREWVHLALSDPRLTVLALTPNIAIDAAQLRFAGDPFDRIIYATARAEGYRLVTRDERMHAFDPELAVW